MQPSGKPSTRFPLEKLVQLEFLTSYFSLIILFERSRSILELVFSAFLEILIELDTTGITDNKIYLFSDILDKKSKLRAFFEKSKKYGVVACYPDNEISIRKIIQEKDMLIQVNILERKKLEVQS